MKNWSQFFIQFQMDFKLWICFMSFFLIFRIVFILMFRNQIERTSSLKTVLAALLNGTRFDCVVATLWALIPFCFSIAGGFFETASWALKARAATGMAFMVSSSIICIITLSYFREFGDQFNHFLFGLIYDDLKATLLTIIKSYNVLGHALGITLTAVAGWHLTKAFIHTPLLTLSTVEAYFSWLPLQVGTTMFIILMVAAGARGTLGFGPPLRERNAAITGDKFLDKTILNPYKSLWYTVDRQLKLSGSDGIKVFLPDKDVVKAAQFVFSSKEQLDDLDDYMLTHAKGPKGTPPRHIFYIVAESYSSWPLWDRYAPLHLADGLKELSREGLSIDNFISGSGGTMGSLNTIITNLPDTGISTNYRPSARLPYPSSISSIFKNLHYKTRFLYGGFLSWQRVGDFCRDQGFEEIYGGGHMGDWASSNEWGVDDEHLFDFVKNTINDDHPSFNIILTTSFHPPYTVDVKAKGFQLDALPSELQEICMDNLDFSKWGHLWYADRCITDFTRWVTSRLPDALVLITADHYSRQFLSREQDIFEKRIIPCVFYGPDVLEGIKLPEKMAGSHLDLTPTLVELIAPAGFAYHTLGKDLLEPRPHPIGIGQRMAVGPSFMIDLNSSPQLHTLPGADQPVSESYMREIKRLHDAINGIAWWRIMHGPEIRHSHSKHGSH